MSLNDYQERRFSSRIIKTLFNTVTSKKIGILGFAFKKNTGDTRESPSIVVCSHLLDESARLHIYDPKVKGEQIFKDLTDVSPKDDAGRVAKLVTINDNAYDCAKGVY